MMDNILDRESEISYTKELEGLYIELYNDSKLRYLHERIVFLEDRLEKNDSPLPVKPESTF